MHIKSRRFGYEKITKPNARTLSAGERLIAKQMKADAGSLLPWHMSDAESILFVHEGECSIQIDNKSRLLKQGEAFIVPPNMEHQIKAVTDFRAVHFMPQDIKFTYFH